MLFLVQNSAQSAIPVCFGWRNQWTIRKYSPNYFILSWIFTLILWVPTLTYVHQFLVWGFVVACLFWTFIYFWWVRFHEVCRGQRSLLDETLSFYYVGSEYQIFKTFLPCLGKVWQSFCLYPVYPVWTQCILSVVKAGPVLCPKASFVQKKTSSK